MLPRCAEKDVGAWWLFLAAPRLCLPVCPKGADSSKDAYHVPTLCRMFQSGEWKTLFEFAIWREQEARKLEAPPASSKKSDAHACFAAKALMEVGEYGRAMQRLASNAQTLPPTGDTAEKLRELHPDTGSLTEHTRAHFRATCDAMLRRAPAASEAGGADAGAPTLVEDESPVEHACTGGAATADAPHPFALKEKDLYRAIRSAPRSSAGAGSGWLYEHVKAVALGDTRFMESLTAALQVMASGNLPPEVARALSASTLVALGKDDGGVRPVAIGEVLTRLVCRAACLQKRKDFEAFFAPNQYGVMTRCGAEQILHTMRAHLAKHTDHVIASMDMTNAFNTVNREAFLQALLDAPEGIRELFPLVAQFYLHDGMLFAYGAEPKDTLQLLSKSGTRQGDPLGPLLFAIAIHAALLRVQEKYRARGIVIMAYLDDIYILGPPSATKAAFTELRAELEERNLRCSLSPGKCWAWSPSGEYGTLLDADATGFSLARCDCPKALGIHLGEGAAEKHVAKVMDSGKAKSLARKIEVLRFFARAGFQPYALLLLLCCAAPSVNYMLRCGRPADTQAAAEAADELLIEAFADISSISAEDLAPGRRARAQLRMRQADGGVGLPSAAKTAKTAYLASWASAGPLIAHRWPHLADEIAALAGDDHPLEYGADVAMQRAYCKEALGLSELIDELMTFTPEAPRPVANGEEPRDDDPMAWQKRFGAAEASLAKSEVKEAVQQHVNASRPRATELQAWLNSLDGDARAAFLHCAPTRWNKLLTGPQLEFAVRRLLRLPLPELAGSKCSCGAIIDGDADHADVCPNQHGERHNRHTHVNIKAVQEPARQANLSPQLEVPNLVEDTNGRPADTGIHEGHGFGDDVVACYDVVGCGACAPSYVEQAARYAGGAWDVAVKKKLRNARRLKAASRDLVVIPMAFTSLGELHPNYQATYKSWALRWATFGEGRSKQDQSALVRCWMARASVAIQRAQFFLVRRMRTHAEGCAHGGKPKAWLSPDISDVDAQRVCCPPMEGQ